MQLIVDAEQHNDGRWVAHVTDLPGVRVYGATRDEAVANAHTLASRVLAFHDVDEISPRMSARIAKSLGIDPADQSPTA